MLKEKLTEFIDFLKSEVPEKVKNLEKAATAKEISDLEKETGIDLPASYSEFLKMHNGLAFMDIFPITKVLDTWGKWKEFVRKDHGEDFTIAEWDASIKPDRGVKKVYWSEKWLPVAKTNDYDCVCLDFDPASGGTKGQVVGFIHDSDDRELLARSFEEWLESHIVNKADVVESDTGKSFSSKTKKPWWKAW